MARFFLTINVPNERLALEGYKYLSRMLADEMERPEWEREMDMEGVAQVMAELLELTREDG